MKKVFIAVALVATMGLSLVSCSKDELKCWKYSYKDNLTGYERTGYMWATELAMENQESLWEKLGCSDIKYSAAPKYKNIGDCTAANVE